MSARNPNAQSRLILYRNCATCGKGLSITADTPWMRQVMEYGDDGKKHQYTRYFCSRKCFAASYKHIGWYDGKAGERRAEREAKRDIKEKNRRYYAAHAEQERARARERYWADPLAAMEANRYQRQKRKIAGETKNG